MISAILSFFGGTAFRMIWGEISHFVTAKQEHAQEMDRMRLQGELEAAQHGRNLDSIRLQAELGVKVIQAQSEADIGKIEAEGWLEAVKGTTKVIGIAFVDAWNAIIRPGVATWSVVMITLGEFALVTLSDNTLMVCSAALGIYLAERNLMKRGK